MFRLRLRASWLAAFVLAGLAGPVFAQSDADFLAAKAAYDKGDRAKLAALAPKLNGHVLPPYVEYWRLKLAIDDATLRRLCATTSIAIPTRRSRKDCAWTG